MKKTQPPNPSNNNVPGEGHSVITTKTKGSETDAKETGIMLNTRNQWADEWPYVSTVQPITTVLAPVYKVR